MSELAEHAGTAHAVLEHAALTDIGLRRGNNQDSFAEAIAGDEQELRRRGNVFMVADGMGAHAAGELASKMACEAIGHIYHKLLDRPPAQALHQAVLTANSDIHERGQANAEFQGMGTTCSVLVLLDDKALVAHVGDSRVYRLRKQQLEQLTFDHSLVWEMLAQGQMPRGEIANFIPKNIITRSLGPHAEVRVDLEGPFALEAGDTFLLCSDGLSGQVKDKEIGVILGALSPEEAVRVLVDMANLRGGPDNITVIAVRVLSVPQTPAEPLPEPASALPPVHPLLWASMALCVLMTLAMVATGYYLLALVGALMAAITVVMALAHNLTSEPKPVETVEGPLGTGPHASFDCAADEESVSSLAQMAQQLRDAAKDEHWTLDWTRFNAYRDQAQAALSAGDYTTAVRDYALAISFVMGEIRRQPPKNPPNGSVIEF